MAACSSKEPGPGPRPRSVPRWRPGSPCRRPAGRRDGPEPPVRWRSSRRAAGVGIPGERGGPGRAAPDRSSVRRSWQARWSLASRVRSTRCRQGPGRVPGGSRPTGRSRGSRPVRSDGSAPLVDAGQGGVVGSVQRHPPTAFSHLPTAGRVAWRRKRVRACSTATKARGTVRRPTPQEAGSSLRSTDRRSWAEAGHAPKAA